MFKPWIGNQFGQKNNLIGGVRILILGESHYTSDLPLIGKEDPSGTIKAIEEYGLGGVPHKFFTKVLQVVAGKKKWSMASSEIREYWHAIAFYNYVPVYVAEGPRTSPTRAMFEMGAAPFMTALKELQPEVIVVCGARLWPWVLRAGGFAGDPSKVTTFQIGSSRLMKMKHPSTAFSSEHWHNQLKAHLEADRDLGAAHEIDPRS